MVQYMLKPSIYLIKSALIAINFVVIAWNALWIMLPSKYGQEFMVYLFIVQTL